MGVNVKIFDALGIFLAVMAVVYGVFTYLSARGIELVGTVGFVLSAGLVFMIGTYLRFVHAKIDLLPEDYEEAEVADGAGELGFFSPGSFWPFLLAFGITVSGFGLVFFNWWVILAGATMIIAFSSALVFEYHWGREKH